MITKLTLQFPRDPVWEFQRNYDPVKFFAGCKSLFAKDESFIYLGCDAPSDETIEDFYQKNRLTNLIDTYSGNNLLEEYEFKISLI